MAERWQKTFTQEPSGQTLPGHSGVDKYREPSTFLCPRFRHKRDLENAKVHKNGRRLNSYLH